MENVIEIKNLEKKYDNFTLNIPSLEIRKGMITGFIGENGAGKTTTIKAILNIIKNYSGEIKIFGNDTEASKEKAKEDIGVVLDEAFFPELLTAKDINSIMVDTFKNWDKELYYKYLKDFQLPVDKEIKTFSKGMLKKLEIITALAHHPKLLILDEPTTGLDPVARREVLDLFQEFMQDENNSIFLSTHITTDLEKIADYITFVEKGKILFTKDINDILDNYAIVKCKKDDFDNIDKDDIVCYFKEKYDIEVLISNKKAFKKKYNFGTIDKISLEELMILMIKGGK